MRVNYRRVVALALFALALSGAAVAQSFEHKIRANIPFSFYASGKLLPAGSYVMTFDMNSHAVAMLRDVKGNGTFVSGLVEDGSKDGSAFLTFHQDNEDIYILQKVQGPDFGVSFELEKALPAGALQRVSNSSQTVLAGESK